MSVQARNQQEKHISPNNPYTNTNTKYACDTVPVEYTRMHTYIPTRTNRHTRICKYTRAHAHVHKSTRTSTQTHTHTHTHTHTDFRVGSYTFCFARGGSETAWCARSVGGGCGARAHEWHRRAWTHISGPAVHAGAENQTCRRHHRHHHRRRRRSCARRGGATAVTHGRPRASSTASRARPPRRSCTAAAALCGGVRHSYTHSNSRAHITHIEDKKTK